MLKKVKIQNFRSFEDAEIELSPRVTLVGGLNGAGKSTLVDAIAVALTGTCRGSETGRGLNELRRTGSKSKWSVDLEFGGELDGTTFQRKEGTGPNSQSQAEIEAILKVPGSTTRACLYAGELLRITPKAVQQMLLDLASAGTANLTKHAAIINEAVGAALFAKDALKKVDLAKMDLMYDAAYSTRREVNRALRETIPQEPAPPEGQAKMKEQTVEQLAELLAKMKKRLKDLEAERDVARKAHTEAVVAPSKVSGRLSVLREEAEQLRAQLADLPSEDEVQTEIQKLIQDVQDAKKALDKANAAMGEAEAERSSYLGLQSSINEELARVENMTSKDECRACGRRLTKTAIDTLHKRASKKGEEYAQQIREATARASKARSAANDAAARFSEAQAKAGQKERVVELVQARKEDLRKLAAKIQELEAAPAAAPDSEAKKLEQAVLDADQRISTGLERCRELDLYLAARRAWEHQASGLESQRKRVEALDAVVKAAGPGGEWRDQLGGKEADKFAADVQQLLAEMGSFTVDFGPALAGKDAPLVNGRPARMLSESEVIRFSVAFAIACAKKVGLPLVIVDRWEELDIFSANRVMMQLANSGLQVIVTTKIGGQVEGFEEQAAKMGNSQFWFALVEKDDGVSTIRALSMPVSA